MTADNLTPIAPLSPESLRVGPYRVESELGTGGMGTVYLAEVREATSGAFGPLPDVGTLVALKCFHPHLVGTEDFAGRFRREAKVGARLQHANVVHTLDAGTAELRGTPTSYMAMEYVEGQTLRELIAELGRLPEELTITVAQQVCAGLRAIHEAGITHRDLKPENVIITGDHHVKLMDLGVAKVRDASIRLSLTGQFLGSVHYASPEQFRDPESVDERTDLYALGILLHEMLTGQNPFYHQDLQVVLRRTLTETPQRVSLLCPEVSPVIDQLAENLAQKDPTARIATAAGVLEVLLEGDASAWWKRGGRTAWEQTGRRRSRRIPVEREAPLIGRTSEMAALRRVFDDVTEGARRIVLLEGEAGVGKTRLIDEFAASLADHGVAHEFTFAAFPPPGTGRAFQAFSEALQRAVEGEELEDALARLLPSGAPIAEFAALVEGRPVGSESLSHDLVRSLFAASFRALAAKTPLLLVLEDAHLASESSANLLAYLARDDRASRVLLVTTYRPIDDTHALSALAHGARDSRIHHHVLGRLGPREVGLLLRAMLQSERLVQELGFRLLERTEGNPFFILEVLRTLKHERVLSRRDDGSWTVSGTRIDIHVPNSVRELLHGSLARLDDEDRELLDVACVIGMEFEPEILAGILGVPRLALLKRLSQIERKHRLVHSAGRSCRFDHHQLQETLYAELMEGLRQEYHALVGEALERRQIPDGTATADVSGSAAMLLAHHFLLGGRLLDAQRYVLPALHHALTKYASEDGARIAQAFLDLDDTAGATSAPALRVEALLALATCLGHEGRRTEERDVLECAATEVEATNVALLKRRTFERRLALHFGLGEFARADVICREALRTATRAKDRTAAIAALGNLGGALRSLGRFDDAVNALRRALSWVVPEGSVLRRCLLTTSLGMVQVHRGHVASAQRLYLQARQIAEGFGMRSGPAVRVATREDEDAVHAQFVGLSRALGRYAESRVDAERTLLLSTAAPQSVREAAALLALGLLAGQLDQFGDARAALTQALAATVKAGEQRFQGAILQALGENAVRAGDAELARSRYAEALELRRKIGHRPGVCESLLALGQVAAMSGDVEAARPYLDEALDLAPALEMPGIAALARATAALLYAREGQHARARAELEEAHRALGGDAPLSISSRAEGLYFAGMAAKALQDDETHAVYLWQAYDLVQEMAERMAPDQRQAFLTATSPNREIVAAVALL